MKKFVLYGGDVWEVIRQDCQGDKSHWLVNSVDGIKLLFVPVKDCTPLDPALNILFERKDDDDKTGDSRRTG